MKKFLKGLFTDNEGNYSTGRFLCLLLFFVVTGMWLFIKARSKELSNNDMQLIQWGWIISIAGKGVSKFAEVMKK